MNVAIVVLNDIHFDSDGSNPPLSRVDSIVAATASENVELGGLVVLLAGDIANTGSSKEYQIATKFLDALKSAIGKRYQGIEIYWLAVPGNHDCILPPEEVDHRKLQVETSLTTILAEEPDKVFLEHLLHPQRDYWEFVKDFDYSPSSIYGKIGGVRLIRFGGHAIQFNLFNSATLSQRHEVPGGIYVPVKLFQREIPPAIADVVTVSIIHHPMQWLEPGNMLALRHFFNRTSDMVITGHQHFNASFSQVHDTGERVLYYESPALHDRSNERPSSFRVLSFDLSTKQLKECVFEWKDSLYRPKPTLHQWKPLELNRGIRPFFTLTEEFMGKVSDPGVVYIHPDRRKIALSDLFVYPDLKATDPDSGGRAIKGADVPAQLSRHGVYVIKGDAFSGKTALAKSLFLNFFIENERIPVFLDATRMRAANTEVFEKRLLSALQEQYSNADVDVYKQLSRDQRVVIIDNWHHARLTNDQRSSVYSWLRRFASSSILFTDKLHEIKQIVDTSIADAVSSTEDPAMSQYDIIGLSHVGRGDLIHRWLNLRKESSLNPAEATKESIGTEEVISRLLGKDRLPPYAFFIICLLQAKENRSIQNIAGGSFGHLYEVL